MRKLLLFPIMLVSIEISGMVVFPPYAQRLRGPGSFPQHASKAYEIQCGHNGLTWFHSGTVATLNGDVRRTTAIVNDKGLLAMVKSIFSDHAGESKPVVHKGLTGDAEDVQIFNRAIKARDENNKVNGK